MSDLSAITPRAKNAPRSDLSFAERLSFLMLTILLCVRPLIPEQFMRMEFSFLAAVTGTFSGPTPATTAGLDALVLAFAVVGLLRVGRAARVSVWVGVSVAVLGGAVVVSSLAAGNPRVALIAGGNLFVTALAGVALVRLMRAPWMPRLLLAGVLASGTVTGVKTLANRYVYQQTTIEQWQQYKETLLERGYDANDPLIVNYERRLVSPETAGFLPHPNLTAAVLVAALLPLLALAWVAVSGLRRGGGDVAGLALVAAAVGVAICGTALGLTGSVGGWLAGLVGIAIGGCAALAPDALRGRRWPAYVVFGVYLLGFIGLIGYGTARDTLPHPSLSFRWDYWTAAWSGYQEAGLTGVGRENFDGVFLQHRGPQSTEEVRNPHNMWVTALVELGPLGLAAFLLGAAVVLVGAWRHSASPQPEGSPPATSAQFGLRWSTWATVAIAVLLLQFGLGDLPKSGVDLATLVAAAFVWLVETASVWLVAFLAFALLLNSVWIGGATRVMKAGLLAALVATLIHNIVGFSLFTPGGLTVFVAIAACGATWDRSSVTTPNHQEIRSWTRRTVALAAGAGCGLLYTVMVAGPPMLSNAWLGRMNEWLQRPGAQAVDSAITFASQAIAVDRWDPTVPRSVARAFMGRAMVNEQPVEQQLAWLERARQAARAGVERDPSSAAAHRTLAQINMALEELYLRELEPDASIAALRRAAEQWRRTVQLSPMDTRARLEAGVALFKLWRELPPAEESSPEDTAQLEALAAEALEQFEAALRIDAARPADAAVRLNDQQLEILERRSAELRTALGSASV
jgi:hypothetical protein